MGFVVLPLGLLSVLLFAFSQTLAYPVIYIVNYLLWGCLRLIEWFAGLSWELFLDRQHFARMALRGLRVYGPFVCPFRPKTQNCRFGRHGCAYLRGLALSNLAGSNDTGVLRVDVIDVGQGSSALVRFPAGEDYAR